MQSSTMDRSSNTSCFKSGASVYSELMWGSKFRKNAKKERKKTTEKKCADDKPKCKIPNPCAKLDSLFAALNAEGKKQYSDPFNVIRREAMLSKAMKKVKKKKSKNSNKKKPKIINRDLLTRRQHIELLAKPRVVPQKRCVKPKVSKKKNINNNKSSDETDLSPRLKQLALPSKRLVFANWSQYQHVLDADTVVRMERILVAGKGENLDPNETKKYFKNKDKQKKKRKKSKQHKSKRKVEKKWLENEVNILADLIVHNIAKERLKANNNRHIQLTNSLIATLQFKGFKIKTISRKTKNLRQKTILGIFDHISVWCDNVFQEAEAIDLEVSVRRYQKMLQKCKEQEEVLAKEKVSKKETRTVSREIIDTLVHLLERGDDKDLDSVIHGQLLTDVTYKQLLEKLRYMRDTEAEMVQEESSDQSLKDQLLKWTERHRPKQLSEDIKNAIGIVSKCLLKIFEAETSSSGTKNGEEKDKELPPPEEGLMSLADDVDLSEIPTYRDPNEDFVEEPVTEADENGFDQSMYVGNQGMIEESDEEGENN